MEVVLRIGVIVIITTCMTKMGIGYPAVPVEDLRMEFVLCIVMGGPVDPAMTTRMTQMGTNFLSASVKR